MTQEIIMTRGVPASGKTTWAREFVKENSNYVNLNRDDFRAMLYGSDYKFSRAREATVTIAQRGAAVAALTEGKSVIISDTNLSKSVQDSWWRVALPFGASIKVTYKNFDCELDVALKRNAMRDGGVPPEVVWRMHGQYMKQVHVDSKVRHDPLLPNAIIVDVDGTVANHEGMRSPYNWGEVGKDTPHEDIIQLVRMLSENFTVIIMTGRDGECAEETKSWLSRYQIPFKHFYIREEGDQRKDSIIKRELFDNNVRGVYNVKYVIDDRAQVVNMWRDLGLRVLDVAGGMF
jgi:predicted kinase